MGINIISVFNPPVEDSDTGEKCLIQSEFNKGASYARDCILANILAVQNSIADETDSEQYKTLQALYVAIKEKYGAMYTDFKG